MSIGSSDFRRSGWQYMLVCAVIAFLLCFLWMPRACAIYYEENISVDTSSYKEFRAATIGKAYNMDNAAGAQCWDGVQLLYHNLGKTLYTRLNISDNDPWAKYCWLNTEARKANIGKLFLKISDITQIRRGDIIIFDAFSEQYSTGHIGFADEDWDESDYIYTYGQNQSRPNDYEGCAFDVHSYTKSKLLGAFRYIKWIRYESISAGNYTFRNVATNTYLTLDGAVDADTANFSVDSGHDDGQGQVFRIESAGEGYKLIPDCSSSGKVVNPYADTPADGTNVNLYHQVSDGTETSQWWQFQSVDKGAHYFIHNVMNPQLVLALSGNNVIVSTFTGEDNQKWTIDSWSGSTTPKLPEKERYFGIDVSEHQGAIDWDTVAQNVDYAIIRCGIAEDKTQYDDVYWQKNVSACERLGIPYGVYLYSYMENKTDAESEADHVIRLLAGHRPSLPVYLDLEDAKVAALSNEQIVQYTNIWLTKIRAAGYNAGVYASYNWWTNRLSGLSLDSKYKWLAAWNSGYESTAKCYAVWQYTSDGSVPGINGRVDCDYCWNLSQWTGVSPVTYCVYYDANGGTGAPESHANAGTVSGSQPTRTGYDFLGWSTDSNAAVAAYQPGSACPTGTNLFLYAVWARQQFTVSFDSDGGTAVADVNVDYGETITPLPIPARKGYAFQGWYNGNSRFTEQTAVTQNLLLKAHWTEHQLTTAKLPAALTTIEEEAFAGSAANVVVIPAGVTSIGTRAFADNSNLYTVICYSTNVTPAANAFENCPNLTIYGYDDTRIQYYAVAKKIPFVALTDDWVPESEVPSGATITDEKWTYTETTESTDSSMTGWTRIGSDWRVTNSGVYTYADYPVGFSHVHALYSAHHNAGTGLAAVENDLSKREVGASSINSYIFWQWAYTDAAHVNEEINDFEGSDGRFEYHLFHAFETTDSLDEHREGMTASGVAKSFDNIWSTWHDDYSRYHSINGPWWWWRLTVYRQNYTDYERVYIFTRDSESATEIQPRNGITNVVHLVKYSF